MPTLLDYGGACRGMRWHRCIVPLALTTALLIVGGLTCQHVPKARAAFAEYQRLRALRREMLEYVGPRSSGIAMTLRPGDEALAQVLCVGVRTRAEFEDELKMRRGLWCGNFRGACEELQDRGMGIGMTTLFMHGRRSHAGNERLVVIGSGFWSAPSELQLVALVAKIDEIGRGQQSIPIRYVPVTFRIDPEAVTDVLHGGKHDPDDASHFTIPYRSNGQSSVIDGWLRDDDTIELTARSVAATGDHTDQAADNRPITARGFAGGR